jgi:hypothetical protein
MRLREHCPLFFSVSRVLVGLPPPPTFGKSTGTCNFASSKISEAIGRWGGSKGPNSSSTGSSQSPSLFFSLSGALDSKISCSGSFGPWGTPWGQEGNFFQDFGNFFLVKIEGGPHTRIHRGVIGRIKSRRKFPLGPF